VSELSKVREEDLTDEKVAFVQEQANRYLAHTIDCYDRARIEGTNVLQWLFATVIGGLGLVGTLIKNEYYCVAFGMFGATIAAGVSIWKLVHAMHSRDLEAPGNKAGALHPLLDQSANRMKWREAESVDSRSGENMEHTKAIADAVDKARRSIAYLPIWGLVGFIVGLAIQLCGAK